MLTIPSTTVENDTGLRNVADAIAHSRRTFMLGLHRGFRRFGGIRVILMIGLWLLGPQNKNVEGTVSSLFVRQMESIVF